MPSRPAIVSVVLSAVILVGVPGPANGVDTSTVPPPLQVFIDACSGTPDGGTVILDGPASPAPPSGAGSLRLLQGDSGDVTGIGRTFDLLSRLEVVELWIHDPDEYGASWYESSSWLDIRVTTAGGTYHLLQGLDQANTAWSRRTFGVTDGFSYHLVKEDDGGWVDLGSTTVPAFRLAHGDGPGVVRIVRAPCFAGKVTFNPGWAPPAGLGKVTYLDSVRITFTGEGLTSYNFEEHEVRASISASKFKIKAGDATKVSMGLTRDGAPYVGQPVRLSRRNLGVSTWTQVASAVTNARGRAAVDVKPKKQTDYKWAYGRNGSTPILRVRVASSISLRFDDSSLRRGQTLVVRGSSSPSRHYPMVRLMRRTTSGPVPLARGTLYGTHYRIEKVLDKKGTYRLFVTVDAGTGIEEGYSATKKVTVS